MWHLKKANRDKHSTPANDGLRASQTFGVKPVPERSPTHAKFFGEPLNGEDGLDGPAHAMGPNLMCRVRQWLERGDDILQDRPLPSRPDNCRHLG